MGIEECGQKVQISSYKINKLQGCKSDFPGGSVGKESACNAGDPDSSPGSGRFPGEGNGNAFQYSYLENSMDRDTWWSTVHEVTKSQTD